METMTEDYVRTARAKGAGPRRVLYRPRPAQRHHPHHHAAGPVHPRHRERGGHHRDRVQLPGHGPARRTRPPPTPTCPLLLGTTLVATLATVVRLAPRRHPLRRGRPEDPLCQVTGTATPPRSDPPSETRYGLCRCGARPSWSPRAETVAPTGGEAVVDRQHVPSDRVGLHREQAGRGRPGRHRRHGALLLAGPGLLPHQPDQRPGGSRQLHVERLRPTASTCSGTDSAGFDILGRLMYGGQNSLIVGLARRHPGDGRRGALYGAVSGFFGGWVDALMMRIVDTLLSIPVLFLLIVLAVVFRPSLTVLILVIAFVVVAGAGPAHPGRDPDPAGARVRAGRQGHGREPDAGSCSATSSRTPSARSS